MFEFIRNHQRWMYGILLLLIVPSFVLVGVSSYTDKGSDANTVATVDGQKVTQQEWDNAQRAQIDRYRQAMGDKFDQKMLDTPEARKAVLDNLINDRVISATIAREHLTVTDPVLAAFYQEQFKGGVDEYKATAASMGLTTQGLDARVRRDMTVQQLTGAIQASAFAPRTVSHPPVGLERPGTRSAGNAVPSRPVRLASESHRRDGQGLLRQEPEAV